MRRAAVLVALLQVACFAREARGPWPPPGEVSALEPRSATVVGFASQQVGKRYCWGGVGPSCFDCSGLVQAAWRTAGVSLPRTSEDQAKALVSVPREASRPGDILWWPGHVGIYIGGGFMIDAVGAKWGVKRRPAKPPDRVLRVAYP